jgi:methylphosphotriester-DNA--protein-cysteine methyltransferase
LKSRLRSAVIISCLLGFAPIILFADDYKYVSSKYSIIYHKPTCKNALKIDPLIKVTFKTAKEALDAQKRPCPICKPPTTDEEEETKTRGF